MSKIIQIKIFNDILDQFLNYLETTFVYLKSEIILSRNSMEFVRKGNPRMVVEQFMQYTDPYTKHIVECDEDFFLNFNNLNLTKEDVLFGTKLKRIWESRDTTDTQKATVFMYFQKLLKAGKKCEY